MPSTPHLPPAIRHSSVHWGLAIWLWQTLAMCSLAV